MDKDGKVELVLKRNEPLLVDAIASLDYALDKWKKEPDDYWFNIVRASMVSVMVHSGDMASDELTAACDKIKAAGFVQ